MESPEVLRYFTQLRWWIAAIMQPFLKAFKKLLQGIMSEIPLPQGKE